MGSDETALRLRTVAVHTGVQLVSAEGELDVSTAPRLERELERVPAAADVIVDVGRARLADAAALRVLRRAAERLRGQGNELTVVCDDKPGARTLLRSEGVAVSEAHEPAVRYLLGRRLLRRLREG
jgi:anti-anti-sigma factor